MFFEMGDGKKGLHKGMCLVRCRKDFFLGGGGSKILCGNILSKTNVVLARSLM